MLQGSMTSLAAAIREAAAAASLAGGKGKVIQSFCEESNDFSQTARKLFKSSKAPHLAEPIVSF